MRHRLGKGKEKTKIFVEFLETPRGGRDEGEGTFGIKENIFDILEIMIQEVGLGYEYS